MERFKLAPDLLHIRPRPSPVPPTPVRAAMLLAATAILVTVPAWPIANALSLLF